MKDDTHLEDKGQVLNMPPVPVNICNNCGMLKDLKVKVCHDGMIMTIRHGVPEAG